MGLPYIPMLGWCQGGQCRHTWHTWSVHLSVPPSAGLDDPWTERADPPKNRRTAPSKPRGSPKQGSQESPPTNSFPQPSRSWKWKHQKENETPGSGSDFHAPHVFPSCLFDHGPDRATGRPSRGGLQLRQRGVRAPGKNGY